MVYGLSLSGLTDHIPYEVINHLFYFVFSYGIWSVNPDNDRPYTI